MAGERLQGSEQRGRLGWREGAGLAAPAGPEPRGGAELKGDASRLGLSGGTSVPGQAPPPCRPSSEAREGGQASSARDGRALGLRRQAVTEPIRRAAGLTLKPDTFTLSLHA